MASAQIQSMHQTERSGHNLNGSKRRTAPSAAVQYGSGGGGREASWHRPPEAGSAPLLLVVAHFEVQVVVAHITKKVGRTHHPLGRRVLDQKGKERVSMQVLHQVNLERSVRLRRVRHVHDLHEFPLLLVVAKVLLPDAWLSLPAVMHRGARCIEVQSMPAPRRHLRVAYYVKWDFAVGQASQDCLHVG